MIFGPAFFQGSGDPLRSLVALHLHFDGSTGSTSLVDSSPSPKSVVASGNAAISNTLSRFGGALTIDGNGDFASVSGLPLIGTGDFDLEGWVYRASGGVDTTFQLFDCRFNGSGAGGQDANGFCFYIRSSNRITFGRGSPFTATEGATTVTDNQWHLIRLNRTSGVVRGFLDGNLDFTVADSINVTRSGARIGWSSDAVTTQGSGAIDEMRLTLASRGTTSYSIPNSPFEDY